MVVNFMALMVIFALQLMIIPAEMQSAQTISGSGINQYVGANCASGRVIYLGRAAVIVFNVEKYGAVGDGQCDSTEAFVRAWYASCRKSSAIFLVPVNKKFLVDGLIAATKNQESGKNSNTKKLESFILIGRGLIGEQGETLRAGECKSVKEQAFRIEKHHRLSRHIFHSNKMQTSVATVERVLKGRTLIESTKPKPQPGGDPKHH